MNMNMSMNMDMNMSMKNNKIVKGRSIKSNGL